MSKISSVIKHGTLRNSCQNYIETRICHLFAGLIAFIDTNRNLDLLTNSFLDVNGDGTNDDSNESNISNTSGASNGRTKFDFASLWLKMFADHELLEINYRLYLLSNNLEKPEFVCSQEAVSRFQNNKETSELRFRLPFSWVIKRTMDELVGTQIHLASSASTSTSINTITITDNTSNQDEEEETIESLKIATSSDNNNNIKNNNSEAVRNYMNLSGVFRMSKLYEKLGESVIDEPEFVNSYLNDYLMLTSAADMCDQPLIFNANHMRILIKRIRENARSVFKKTDLVAVTLSWNMLKNELGLFAKFVRLHPKVRI